MERGGGGGAGRGVFNLANYSVAYEETQSKRVSDIRNLCVLWFQRQSFFDFYFTLL